MFKDISRRIMLISLLLPAMVAPLGAEGLDRMDPEMGYQVASTAPVTGASTSKLDKLNDAVRQAAEQYKQGHFDKAAEWYASAIQLEPERKDLQQSLANAQQMHGAQQKAQAQLPRDAAEREKFLNVAFNQAQQYYDREKYPQASQAFYKLWLTAGDYQGKTLRAYRAAQDKLKASSSRETAVASATSEAVPAPATGSAEVLLDEVVAPAPEGKAIAATAAPASPGQTDAQLNQARAAIKTGYYDDAQRLLKEILARDPGNAAARAELNKIQVLTDTAAKLATARQSWQSDRKVAQASTNTLQPVYANGSSAVATTATLTPVAQSTPSPTPEPTPAPTPEPTPAPTPEATATPQPAPAAAPAAASEPAVAPAEEGALVPANAGSTTGGPTGGMAEGATAAAAVPAATGADGGVTSGPDDLTRLQANRLIRQAELLAGEGKYDQALETVRQAQQIWPDNPRVQELITQYTTAAPGVVTATSTTTQVSTESVLEKRGGTPAEIQSRAALGHQLDELQRSALEHYDAGDIGRARELWNQMLQLDPGNKLAHTWLENTKEAYQRQLADGQTRADMEAHSEAAQKLLNSPITIATDRRIPLSEFMSVLSYATPVGLQYYIVSGADATTVFANFVNKPLREVLDTVLLPIGLSWSIDQKNVITIQPKLVSRTYKLTTHQMSQLRALMDSQKLQQIIWGQIEAPAPGVDITLDERQNILIVTGSQLHIQKVDNFLPTLVEAAGADLEMKIYKIRPEDGPKIKALINAIIQASPDTPFNLERKIFIDGEDLIIRDTPDNITKIEELLINKQFIQALQNEKLDIRNYSLVPKDVENVQSDQVQNFTARVVEAIQVFLYNTEGIAKAREQGRRLWFDEATLQLTVVDTPSNLQRVSEYIEALPELRQRNLQKVRYLKYQLAEDLSASLLRILDLTDESATGGGGENGDEAVFKLRRGEERQFRNTRIRVLRVEQNDVEDRNDDSVELTLSVPGTGPQNQTLTELDSQLVDDYEITAEDVLPSSGNPGEGSARIRIRYVPQGLTREALAGGTDAQGNPITGTGGGGTSTLEEAGISINPFGDLNALVIRYTNPGLYQDVEELIQQLDQPTKQVEIETKFVEVNESRAKEFSSDFNLANLGAGRGVDFDESTYNTRYAQDIDEFRDVFSPPIENPLNANLIKGTTVFGAVFGAIPQLQFNLRLLEAEGIINVVNGPKVMSLNGEEAEFRIESSAPQTDNEGGGTGVTTTVGGGTGTDTNTIPKSLTITNPYGRQNNSSSQNGSLADLDEATPDQGLVSAVVLRMTPSITSENSIILRELSAELLDFEGYVSSYATRNVTNVPGPGGGLIPGSRAQTTGLPLVKRKKIITYARIGNGGTIVIGGWTGERSQELTSGVPVLRNMPYLGKLLFSRNQRSNDRTTLLIFLTGFLVD